RPLQLDRARLLPAPRTGSRPGTPCAPRTDHRQPGDRTRLDEPAIGDGPPGRRILPHEKMRAGPGGQTPEPASTFHRVETRRPRLTWKPGTRTWCRIPER